SMKSSSCSVVASDTGRKRKLSRCRTKLGSRVSKPQAWCRPRSQARGHRRSPADVRARRPQRSGSHAQRWFRVDLWPRACDRGRFVLRDPWRRNQRPWYSRDRPSLEPSDSRRDGGRARELRVGSRHASDDGRRPVPRLRISPQAYLLSSHASIDTSAVGSYTRIRSHLASIFPISQERFMPTNHKRHAPARTANGSPASDATPPEATAEAPKPSQPRRPGEGLNITDLKDMSIQKLT